MLTFKTQMLLLTYRPPEKCFQLLLLFLIPYNEFSSIHPPPSRIFSPDSLLASIYWRENSMGLHASEPRSLPLGGGHMRTCSKQGSFRGTDHNYQWPGNMFRNSWEKMPECWRSFWDGLEFISLSINRQMCSSNIRVFHCTTALFSLGPVTDSKSISRKGKHASCKILCVLLKEKWPWVKKPFQNKHSILTLILATKIQFGWAVWRVDLTLFPEQRAMVWRHHFYMDHLCFSLYV